MLFVVIMAKFAHDCLLKMKDVCRDLETTLGPETGDLGMRYVFSDVCVGIGVSAWANPVMSLDLVYTRDQ